MTKRLIYRNECMMTEEMKKWIDEASYEQLLSKWRFAPVGSPFFVDETGKYYEKKMAEKRSEVGVSEHVRISKAIGWRKE